MLEQCRFSLLIVLDHQLVLSFNLIYPILIGFQSLSTFRIEANMHKAKSSDESIGVNEALRYLKATKFNSAKAIDVFKNYHVSRESAAK